MITELPCRYPDREAALIAIVYDDLEPEERAAIEAHVGLCSQCRNELEELRATHEDLAAWPPPVPVLTGSRRLEPGPTAAQPAPRGWRELPAWAQVAAALLFLGVSAGMANLDVRYGTDGLSVRTGWLRLRPDAGASQPVASPPSRPQLTPAAPQADSTPWRADLVALERQLRSEMAHATQPAVPAARPVTGLNADAIRRVRAMIEESERRQNSELALRVAGVVRDVEAQRRADLAKIDRNLGLIQNNTGVEVMRQRELLNYLVRASQKQ